MGRLVECEFCERLYSAHSLSIHQPQCADNPNSSQRIADVKKQMADHAKRKKMRRSRSQETRKPKGNSTFRADAPAQTMQHNIGPLRLCYVCGNPFEQTKLAAHEETCLMGWTKRTRQLPEWMTTRRPRPLNVPSIDGSVDIVRQNVHAIEQSGRASRVGVLGEND
ncbi:unnamed protein product, partial [Mesorhabditis spiculigera]